MSPPVTAPAIGYSVVCNLPGDRQVTAQCFVAEDESDKAVHAKFDRMFSFLDRQKAKYEIPELEDKIAQQEATLAQLNLDLESADAEYETAQAGLDVQIEEVQKSRDAAWQAGYDAHVANARRGSYEPRGAEQAKLTQHDGALAQLAAEKAKNTAERDQFRNNILVGKKRYESAIAADRETLARKVAILAANG